MNNEKLGDSFIKALNDFEKKGNVNIRVSGQPTAHLSIIVDRTDDTIEISSPTCVHMSHRQLIRLDDKLNEAGKFSWLVIKKYGSLINHSSIAKRIIELNPKQSKEFMGELFFRMIQIIDDGGYDTEKMSIVFQAIYNAFDGELDNMILEVINDILDNRPTSVNVCRTCKYCQNMGKPGYGRCQICTFTPSNGGENATIAEFQQEYGKHVFTNKGVIYTDITTGCDECDDYVKRPINFGSAFKTWWYGN